MTPDIRMARFSGGVRTGPFFVGIAVFLIVVAVGTTASLVRKSDLWAPAVHPAESSETQSSLEHYVKAIDEPGMKQSTSARQSLLDVETLIGRLAERLRTKPQDIEGWRMLGWSYFHTSRYDEAATAYARALELDPGSGELRTWFEQAKAKSQGRAAKAAD